MSYTFKDAMRDSQDGSQGTLCPVCRMRGHHKIDCPEGSSILDAFRARSCKECGHRYRIETVWEQVQGYWVCGNCIAERGN